MRILVVAATEAEIRVVIDELRFTIYDLQNTDPAIVNRNSEIVNPQSEIVNPESEILITGVGMVATAFALGRHLAVHQYDLVINLGIAGSFDRGIALGDIVEITQDTIAELGAEDDEAFLSIDKLGFGESVFYPTTSLFKLYNTSDPYNQPNPYNLKTVAAITVNTVHGNEMSIKKVAERLNPQLESMEGAAFFYACREMNVACLQIRAVSNYVEKRNRDNWKIGLAIKNLNTFALQLVKELIELD